MKSSIIVSVLLLFAISVHAKALIKGIKKIDNGLYILSYDSTQQKKIITKSLIVEYKNYIVLFEVPITNGGGGQTRLTDHFEDGEEVIKQLAHYFPGKPIKYVLSSHWHPHSLSALLPFISQGIKVVSTIENFKLLNQMIDTTQYNKYKQNLIFVGDEGLTLGERNNEIKVYRLNKTDYPNIPTEDFLFFYVPKYQCLHNSCMFQRFPASRVFGKEMVSSRVEDLNKFVAIHNLAPKYLITTDTYWDEPKGYVSGDTLRKMMQAGIGMGALANDILSYNLETMATNMDSLLKYLMDNNVPYSILNIAVYEALKKNQLGRALATARLLVLINPSSPGSWDTYGEVYYFMGDTKMAKKYEGVSKRIDKDFELGGEVSWKKDLELYRAMWNKNQ